MSGRSTIVVPLSLKALLGKRPGSVDAHEQQGMCAPKFREEALLECAARGAAPRCLVEHGGVTKQLPRVHDSASLEMLKAIGRHGLIAVLEVVRIAQEQRTANNSAAVSGIMYISTVAAASQGQT